jgi:hypothetical protein
MERHARHISGAGDALRSLFVFSVEIMSSTGMPRTAKGALAGILS